MVSVSADGSASNFITTSKVKDIGFTLAHIF